MNISTKLTPRDKKLLIFLAVFILLVATSWFVFRPLGQDITDLNKQIAEAEILQRQNQHDVSRIEENEAALQEKSTELLIKAADIYPIMEAQDIDRLLTTEALRFGFDNSELRELTISLPENELILLPYLEPEQKAVPSEENEPPKGLLTGLTAADVSFTLQAKRELLEGFCDSLVNDYPSIRVSEFYWKKDITKPEVYILTLHCQIYMSNAQSITGKTPTTQDKP